MVYYNMYPVHMHTAFNLFVKSSSNMHTSLSETLSLNSFFQALILGLGGNGFLAFIKVLVLWLGVAWLLAVIWVFKDALQRYNNLLMPVIWLIVVLPFNLLGLLAYVILRPVDYAIDQEQEKLGLKLYKAELLNFIECPSCGAINKRSNDYCTECGLKLFAFCPKCQKKVYIDWQFCKYCGIKLEDSLFDITNNGVQDVLPAKEEKHQNKSKNGGKNLFDHIEVFANGFINNGIINIISKGVTKFITTLKSLIKFVGIKTKQLVVFVKKSVLFVIRKLIEGISYSFNLLFKIVISPFVAIKHLTSWIFKSMRKFKISVSQKHKNKNKDSRNLKNKKNHINKKFDSSKKNKSHMHKFKNKKRKNKKK